MKNLCLILITIILFACGKSQTTKLPTVSAKSDSINIAYHRADSVIMATTNYTVPKAYNYVNDFEDIIDDDKEKDLNTLIGDFKDKTSNEVSVCTITDFSPYNDDIGLFTYHLGNVWGVGNKDKDNGVIIVVSAAKHRVHITPGIGIENILTPVKCKDIIDNIMIPEFKKGDYSSGIFTGVMQVIKSLEK